jgi:hypothetical protein
MHMKAYFIVWQNESLSWPRPTVVWAANFRTVPLHNPEN